MDRKHEILAKLELIRQQAQLTLDELPLRLAKYRLRLIIGLTRYLSTTVNENWQPEISPPDARAASTRQELPK